MKGRLGAAAELLGPVALVVATGVLGAFVSNARSLEFVDALISTATVVALYVFVGNSGVLSFGQISFFIVGAYVAGELTVPADAKPSVLPQVFSIIRDHTVGNAWSLVLATAVGAVFALVVGAPLMRLTGLAAGIATFAVLEITHNIVRELGEDRARPADALDGAGDDRPLAGDAGDDRRRLRRVPVSAEPARAEAPSGARGSVRGPGGGHRHPPAAALGVRVVRRAVGVRGGLYVHFAGTINVEDVYLELTFLTLAMLVVGGSGPCWGRRRRAGRQRARFVPLGRRERRRELVPRDSRNPPGRRGGVHGRGSDLPPGRPDRPLADPASTPVKIWSGTSESGTRRRRSPATCPACRDTSSRRP